MNRGRILQFDNTPEQSRLHRVKGGRSRGHRFAHVVSGELVSTAQIAARLGVGTECVLARVKRVPHPMTWEALANPPRSRKKQGAT